MDPRDYPPDWEDIRQRVGERSGWRCEAETRRGRCQTVQKMRIHRTKGEPEEFIRCQRESHGDCVHCALGIASMFHPAITVVLTVAHTCQDSSCRDLDHLAHWCQLHHLRYDAAQHGRNAAATRRSRRLALQPELVATGE